MICPKELILNDYDRTVPLVNKTIFWDNFGLLDTPKCENNKTIDAMKVTAITTENVSEAKKLENVSNMSRSDTSREATKPTRHSYILSKIPKRIIKVDVKKPNNAIQHQDEDPATLIHCVHSEPSFDTIIGHENNGGLSDDSIEDRKSLLPMERILKGCIFIKNEGNVYKSAVEAKALDVCERNVFENFSHDYRSTSTNKLDQNVHRNNGRTNEASGFQIAIYLSGLVSSDGEHNKQHVEDSGNKQQKECQVKYNREEQKKKKFHASKSNVVCDKSYEIENQVHPSPSTSQKVKKRARGKSSCRKTRQTAKQNVVLDISGDDSDVDYELDEYGKIVPKRKIEENLENHSNDVGNSVKERSSGQLSYRSSKSTRTKSTFVSQSSLSCYSNGYGYTKSKVNEESMWEMFEVIFKNYASTHRHSGEVIPRKISTEWMKNSGVISAILTQKQAEDAFRKAAGAKITMNAWEYKEFLIKLSLRLKLPYYEIYGRMCGI